MAEPRKQEKDYTPETDIAIGESTSLAGSNKLREAIEKLLALEKQTRNASDQKSTLRLATTILSLSYDAGDYLQLNSNASLLCRKHGQMKSVVQAIVEQCMNWLDGIKDREGLERWLELVETLRQVTEGKIFLETPRARVTLSLSRHYESLANNLTPSATPQKSLETACELLSELQVETYSSMEKKEKTEFLLEQMRLFILVAKGKNAEDRAVGKDDLSRAETEWIKAKSTGRKVNEDFLKGEGNELLKLKFYDLMIQHALHAREYLDIAKYYHKIWETPIIKMDIGKNRETLEHIVYYIVLAPHNNEQSDMLHRVSRYPELTKLDLQYNLVKCFTMPELMRWPGIEGIYGQTLLKTDVFGPGGEKRWEDLHTRVIEHNVRVVSQYYTRITMKRLTALLDLSGTQTEEILCGLVVSKTIWARIDRPSGIINFRDKKTAEDVMNEWSSDMQRLLGLVEKTWMGMNAALAAQSRLRA